jgi:NADH:ubiquinone oxidoreductase subunit F (NADH-binding)
MTATDVALVIGAIAAATTTITAAFIAVRGEIKKVHSIVNQAATDSRAYNLLLSNTLRSHGIDVPVDAAVVPPEEPS